MTIHWFWIASLSKRKTLILPALASAARSAVGHLGSKTAGPASAATYGTHLTPGEFAPPVFISGLQPSAARASGGRRIRIGMRPDKLRSNRVTFRNGQNEAD